MILIILATIILVPIVLELIGIAFGVFLVWFVNKVTK